MSIYVVTGELGTYRVQQWADGWHITASNGTPFFVCPTKKRAMAEIESFEMTHC